MAYLLLLCIVVMRDEQCLTTSEPNGHKISYVWPTRIECRIVMAKHPPNPNTNADRPLCMYVYSFCARLWIFYEFLHTPQYSKFQYSPTFIRLVRSCNFRSETCAIASSPSLSHIHTNHLPLPPSIALSFVTSSRFLWQIFVLLCK